MAEKIVFELKIDHRMESCVLDLGPMPELVHSSTMEVEK